MYLKANFQLYCKKPTVKNLVIQQLENDFKLRMSAKKKETIASLLNCQQQ